MSIRPNIALQQEMTQRQLRADQEHLRATWSRLLKTMEVIERATVAIAESRAVLISDKARGTGPDTVD
jgi:hypothetical protein